MGLVGAALAAVGLYVSVSVYMILYICICVWVCLHVRTCVSGRGNFEQIFLGEQDVFFWSNSI